MAEDGISMKHLVVEPKHGRPAYTQTAVLSGDEQQLAHFGKRQQFRVSQL